MSADTNSCRDEVVRQIVEAVQRIEQLSIASGGAPDATEVMAVIAELDQRVTGTPGASDVIARQIALWFQQVPHSCAPALTTHALAGRARRLLYDS